MMLWTAPALRHAKAAAGKWEPSNAATFVTKPGRFTDMVRDAIIKATGRTPTLAIIAAICD
jgi:hypothetical protein